MNVDVEIFGYRNVSFTPKPTDIRKDKDGLRYCVARVHPDKFLVIDLGNGREIRITFRATETNISRRVEDHSI